MNTKLTILLVVITLVVLLHLQQTGRNVEASELAKTSRAIGKLGNFFSNIKRASVRGVNLFTGMLASIPITKIMLAGGALLSLFFIFIRLLIVLGPILILGAMTRESTDTTDFLRILIEFYNQVLVALDEQIPAQDQPLSS